MKILIYAALLGATAAAQPPSPAATPPAGPWDPAARLAAQREAMKALNFMDGQWRGGAKADEAPGDLVQTERVGPLLGGSVKLVEGRGYDAAGKTVFNAFAIISYDPVKRVYSMRSHAMGYAGDYPLSVRPDGFSWSHPAGPNATIRYTATIRGGEWHEIGERIAGDAPPAKTLEMRLRRLGPTKWPEEGTVPPR